MQVYYRGERIAFTELLEPKQQGTQVLPPPVRAQVVKKAKKDHPWRRGYQNMKPWVPSRELAGPPVGIRPSASP